MAEAKKTRRKARVRKAPTLREQAEMARTKNEEEKKPRRARRIASRAVSPVKKVHVPSNPVTRGFAKAGRGVKRVFKWLIPKYFVNSWREVRLVTWPSRKETWRLTLAVFIFAVIFGALVAGVDKGLDLIFKKVVLK